jgi:hypothetical protein
MQIRATTRCSPRTLALRPRYGCGQVLIHADGAIIHAASACHHNAAASAGIPCCCNDPQDPKLGSWYPLLLVTVYGWADLLGKLLPGVK